MPGPVDPCDGTVSQTPVFQKLTLESGSNHSCDEQARILPSRIFFPRSLSMNNVGFSFCEKFHKLHNLLLANRLAPVSMPSRSLKMNSELQSYRESVQQLMTSRSSKPVSNGKPEHAAVLFELFFKNASNYVKIFCHNLDARVFDCPEVIEAAADAAKRGIAIDIIVQNQPQSTKFLQRLEALDKKESIRLDLVKNAGVSNAKLNGLEVNFAVMDGYAYRIEPDSSKLEAFACMNHPATGNQLVSSYNSLRHSVAAA